MALKLDASRNFEEHRTNYKMEFNCFAAHAIENILAAKPDYPDCLRRPFRRNCALML